MNHLTDRPQVRRRPLALKLVPLAVAGTLAASTGLPSASAAAAPEPPGTAAVTSVPVTAFSLSDQRLVDNDARQVNGADVPGTYNTKVTTINVHTGVGHTGTVHRPTYPISVHASAAGTAYLPDTGSANQTSQDLTWVVRTPRGSTSLQHAAGDRWFSGRFDLSTSLSGNRFLYSAQPGTDNPRAYVFDASTGRRTLVQSQVGYAAPALFGDFVVTMHADGSVWRRDLVSGSNVALSGPTSLPVSYGELFAWGDYVGWNLETGDSETGPTAQIHAFRNAETMAPAHSVDQPIQQLSSAGVVLRTDHLSESDQPTAYDLLTYAGTSTPLLASDTYRLAPQVVGRAMAWADPAGLLKIAQLDVPLANPRYLGAPYEPATRINNPTRSHYWTASLPFAGEVTNCSVQIRYGARVIQNRSCGGVRPGELDPAWNAIANDGGPVRAGTYHVRLYSPQSDPSTVMLDANGDARPIVFTVLVGHATRTALHAVPARVRHGGSSVLSAHLTTTLGSKHAHRNVSFYRRLADGTWHRIGTRKTSAAGTARLRVRPGRTAVYRADFTGSRIDRPSTSTARRVTVR